MIQVRAIPRIDVLRWLRTEDWITFVLTAGVALIVIRSIESAEWVATPSLSLAALLGAFAGLIIARSPLAGWRAYLAAALLGLLLVYLQALGLVEGESFTERVSDLNTRLWSWLNAIFGNGISTDAVPFAVILSSVAWSAGYLSAWAVFRLTKIWIAVVPASVGLFINLTYLPETHFSVVFSVPAGHLALGGAFHVSTTPRVSGQARHLLPGFAALGMDRHSPGLLRTDRGGGVHTSGYPRQK